MLRKLARPSPTSGGRSAAVVRSRTKATELVMWKWDRIPPPHPCEP
jgi:hypothetical protein